MDTKEFGISGNSLKILAMLAMTVDHACKQLPIGYPLILQMFGRIAFPIFAYMIAEGCFYTKNRARYLAGILTLGLGCQTVYYFAEGSLYQNILLTFSVSIATIFCIDSCIKRPCPATWLILIAQTGLLAVIYLLMPSLLSKFELDYGFVGMTVPVIIYFAPKKLKLAALGLALCLLAARCGTTQ